MASDRQARVEELLRQRGPMGATTIEIVERCGVASARDYVRRLRDHGLVIDTVEEPHTASGARVVRYVLREQKAVANDLFGG